MEAKRFTEKESLELISEMIRSTRKNMEVGSGNVFLCYGYSTVAISVVVYTLISLTQNPVWSALWFLMFVPSAIISRLNKKKQPPVVTYLDRMIDNTWQVVGSLFGLTVLAIMGIGTLLGECHFTLMLPLCLLYAGIGTAITGIVTKVKVLVYSPLVGFGFALYMLQVIASGAATDSLWHLYFGGAFLAMMVIPGHLLNKKSTNAC